MSDTEAIVKIEVTRKREIVVIFKLQGHTLKEPLNTFQEDPCTLIDSDVFREFYDNGNGLRYRRCSRETKMMIASLIEWAIRDDESPQVVVEKDEMLVEFETGMGYDTEMCCVCMEEFELGQMVCMTSCKHILCPTCSGKWAGPCPTCRR